MGLANQAAHIFSYFSIKIINITIKILVLPSYGVRAFVAKQTSAATPKFGPERFFFITRFLLQNALNFYTSILYLRS